MEVGDIVRVRHQGRTYLAQITETTSRTAHIKFLSQAPTIKLSRRSRRSFPLTAFHEYGKAGVDWTVTEIPT